MKVDAVTQVLPARDMVPGSWVPFTGPLCCSVPTVVAKPSHLGSWPTSTQAAVCLCSFSPQEAGEIECVAHLPCIMMSSPEPRYWHRRHLEGASKLLRPRRCETHLRSVDKVVPVWPAVVGRDLARQSDEKWARLIKAGN